MPTALQRKDSVTNVFETASRSFDRYDHYDGKRAEIVDKIQEIILQDWMYGYGHLYCKEDFSRLQSRIADLVSANKPLWFFLPAFPVKSSNTEEKVFGEMPDFAEHLAIRTLLKTARKLEAVYDKGAMIIIMSDYHTFDQYIGVSEEAYNIYHKNLRRLIRDAGADDVIKLFSLSSFSEFANVPGPEISTVLRNNYGGEDFLSAFDDMIANDPSVLNKYRELRKFMLTDLKYKLPGSTSSKATKRFIKPVARGMMAQGHALDNFLAKQKTVKNFIRLSIHHHHPQSGKFAVNLFNEHVSSQGTLRTPWHHVVVFDSKEGKFIIDQKRRIEEAVIKGSILVKVTYNNCDWLYLRLYIAEEYIDYFGDKEGPAPFEVTMYRPGCGMMIRNKLKTDSGKKLPSDCIKAESLSQLIKEFGLVVLRDFEEFSDEQSMIRSYKKRAPNGILEWQFGVMHKIKPSEESTNITSSFEGLPMHFDMVALPRYMGISQEECKYEDYVCRELFLFCKESSLDDEDGQTTFIDAHAAVTSLHGGKMSKWKQTVLVYETEASTGKENDTYFGGRGNVYEYPLIMECPWTGKDVLRWLQDWSLEEHPNSRQVGLHRIKSMPGDTNASEALETEIRKVAFDERFYFGHSYAKGDQVYVNNYTTLHGRNGFSNQRELWRLQAIPPSENLPSYFVEHSL